MNRGWIKLYRSILDWEWFSEPDMIQVYLFLIASANHQSKKWRGMEIKRGQLATSIETIRMKCKSSTRRIRTILSRLKSTNELTIETTKRYTIITICNYDSYQVLDDKSDKASDKASDSQATTNKNDKNNNNKNNSNTSVLELQKKENLNEVENFGNNTAENNSEDESKYPLKAKPEEKEKSSAKKEKENFKNLILASGVSESSADTWIKIRSRKKAVFTMRAWELTNNQIKLSGLTHQQAIDECIIRNWQGFNLRWIQDESKSKNKPFQQSKTQIYDDGF